MADNEAGKWIDVNEDRPKVGQRIICRGYSGSYFITNKIEENSIIFQKGKWRAWDYIGKWRPFTHWFVIPEFSMEANVDGR